MSKTDEIRKKASPTALIIGRGISKPNATLYQMGLRNGKAQAAVNLEVMDEMLAYPPATAEEAEVFCRLQIKRCNINLANAKDRGDKRAVLHLVRKLAVYEYLHRLVKEQTAPPEGTTSCPNCLVHAVEENGVCACCGNKED